MENNLVELQKKLDEKKWFESQIARQDLGGKMFYCEGCPFRNSYLKICATTQQEREQSCMCAKMELKRKEPEKLVIKPRFSKTKKKTPSTKNNAFMKEVDEAYEEALTYALFDVTKNECKK